MSILCSAYCHATARRALFANCGVLRGCCDSLHLAVAHHLAVATLSLALARRRLDSRPLAGLRRATRLANHAPSPAPPRGRRRGLRRSEEPGRASTHAPHRCPRRRASSHPGRQPCGRDLRARADDCCARHPGVRRHRDGHRWGPHHHDPRGVAGRQRVPCRYGPCRTGRRRVPRRCGPRRTCRRQRVQRRPGPRWIAWRHRPQRQCDPRDAAGVIAPPRNAECGRWNRLPAAPSGEASTRGRPRRIPAAQRGEAPVRAPSPRSAGRPAGGAVVFVSRRARYRPRADKRNARGRRTARRVRFDRLGDVGTLRHGSRQLRAGAP